MFDYSSYKKFVELVSVDDLDALEDGVYRIGSPGHQIDILLDNFDGKQKVDRCLIVFTGAIYRRETKAGPFFSGRRISLQASGIPTICISDPILEIDDLVEIGWYIGYRGRERLAHEIADILDKILDRLKCYTFVVGGSAGGFAALNITPYMRNRCTVLAFNPQTSVARYWYPHVNRYFSAATNKRVCASTLDEVKQVFSQLGVSYEICYANLDASPHNFIYIQNSSDSHLKSHLRPFVASGRFQYIDKNTLLSEKKKITIWIGSWGSGHAPLPAEAVAEVISIWRDGEATNGIISYLASKYDCEETEI